MDSGLEYWSEILEDCNGHRSVRMRTHQCACIVGKWIGWSLESHTPLFDSALEMTLQPRLLALVLVYISCRCLRGLFIFRSRRHPEKRATLIHWAIEVINEDIYTHVEEKSEHFIPKT